ncbi:MAG: DUF4886 domain-containing protein [Clostridia bacterium]|nr:DUF4886 domain-containing protein [Clostridia bacterium]
MDPNTPCVTLSDWDKNGLKVLTVGNSFSGDSYAYLHDILTAHGATDVTLCYLYIPGGTLADHAASIAADSATYRLHTFDTNGHDITEENKFSAVISSLPWDLIVLQQGSSHSGLSDSYSPLLQTVLDAAKEGCTNPDVEFAWNMTWAYQQTSAHEAFANYRYDQLTMYHGIVKAVEENVCTNPDVSFFFPCGTAVQNARTSSLGDTLTKDGHHLSPFGRYLASYTWYACLTGETLTEAKFTPDDQTLSENDLQILIQCVNAAIANPLAITEISN